MNGERPDVLGLAEGEALRRLEAAGVSPVAVVETAPPRGAKAGERRVVRIRGERESVELIVAAFPGLQVR